MRNIISIAIVIVFSKCILVESLRCQTQDSENDERFQKVYRKCIKQFQRDGSDEYNDDGNSSEDYSSNEDQPSYSKNDNNKNHQQQQHNKLHVKRQNQDQQPSNWDHNNNNYNNNNNNNNKNENGNQTLDRSCLFHCVFQEMKMVV